MKKLLTKEEESYIIASIKQGTTEIDVSVVPLREYMALFEELGFEMDELDNNLNGFSSDFMYTFRHKTLGNYDLTGSLWYGNYGISISDEDDDIDE